MTLIKPQLDSAATGNWLDRGLTIALLLTCALVLSKNFSDPDLWGHVQYGRDLMADGLPATSTYSYNSIGYRWINHENLSELLLAIGMDTIGPPALLTIKCLLGVAIIALIVRRAIRQEVNQFVYFLVALLVAMNLMHFWSMRPQLLSYMFFTAMVALLVRWEWQARPTQHESSEANERGLCYETRSLRWMWIAPPLFAVWANTHGAFVAGYCIFAAYFVCRSCEAIVARRRAAFPFAAHAAAIVAISGLATLLNPYGWELHAWLLESLGTPRPEIIEWRPPEFLSIVWIQFWLLAGLFVGSVFLSRERRDFTHLVLLSITLWQAVEHRRHIPFFAILFGFWMLPHVASLLARLNMGRGAVSFGKSVSPRTRPAFVAVLVVACSIVSLNLFKQLRRLPVRRDQYPVSAFQYIADQELSGKLVLRFMWAQYAIDAFGSGDGSGIQVAFDGRFRTCYPQEIVDMYFDFALGDQEHDWRFRSPNAPPIASGRILEFNHPDLVLVDRRQKNAAATMNSRRGEWVKLYQDELAQLWGRRAKFDDSSSSDFIPAPHRRINNERQEGAVAWPALPTRTKPSSPKQIAGT